MINILTVETIGCKVETLSKVFLMCQIIIDAIIGYSQSSGKSPFFFNIFIYFKKNIYNIR